VVRGVLKVLLAWLVGPPLAFVVLFLWPAFSLCPTGQACALEPVPLWRMVLAVLVLFGPGWFATREWWRTRRRPDGEL
jgi:hypothetical protein